VEADRGAGQRAVPDYMRRDARSRDQEESGRKAGEEKEDG